MLPRVAVFAPRSCVKRSLISATIFALSALFFAIFLLNSSTDAFCQGKNGSNFDGPAELPRVYIQSTLADTPAPGHTIRVGAAGDLQSALDNASCGDTIELQAGASFAGNFTLPAKPCDDQHWIFVRTGAPDSALPPEGTRLTPCYAGVPALPGRPDFHCVTTANVMAKLVLIKRGDSGPLFLAAGANHYRLIGLEITRLVGSGPAIDLILPKGMADHIFLDRVWVHGTAQDETRRGILLSGITNAAIIDSYFSDFHCTALSGTCTDSQAIGGGSSTFAGGPFKIVNNFLEAAGECILFGGGASTTTPTDIEIRRNHLFKPIIWQLGQAGFVGGTTGDPFIVKNLFELKNAQRVLFEANILENTWGGFTQHGFAVVLTPRGFTRKGSDVNLCAVCQVTDVTIRYSTIGHMAGGFLIATAITKKGASAQAGARFSIHDVVLDDIDGNRYVGHSTLLHIANSWSRNVLNNVTIDHITGFPATYLFTVENTTNNPEMYGFVFTNNVVSSAEFPIFSAGGGKANCSASISPLNNLSNCFRTYTFKSNVIIGPSAMFPPSTWPAGNFFPEDSQAVGFLNFSTHDYSLLSSSPYSRATDGTNPGADIEAIEEAVSGVN